MQNPVPFSCFPPEVQQKLIDATERYFAARQKVAGGKWS